MSEIPQGRPAFPGISGRCPRPAGSVRFPLRIGSLSELLRGRPAVPDDSPPYPRARGFDQLSRSTRAHVRGPARSTSSPWGLGPRTKGRWGRLAFPGDSGPCLRDGRFDQLSRANQARVQGLQDRSDVLADLTPCQRCRCVDQLSLMTRAHVRVLKVSTSCPGLLQSGPRARGFTSWPGQLVPGSEVPRVRPSVPGDSGPCSSAHGVDKYPG